MMYVEGLCNSIQHSPYCCTHTGLLLLVQAEKVRWLPLECDWRGPFAPRDSPLLFYCLEIPPLDIPFSKGVMLPLTQKHSPQLADGKTAIMEEKPAPFLFSYFPFSPFPTAHQMHERGVLVLPTIFKANGWTSLSSAFLSSPAWDFRGIFHLALGPVAHTFRRRGTSPASASCPSLAKRTLDSGAAAPGKALARAGGSGRIIAVWKQRQGIPCASRSGGKK